MLDNDDKSCYTDLELARATIREAVNQFEREDSSDFGKSATKRQRPIGDEEWYGVRDAKSPAWVKDDTPVAVVARIATSNVLMGAWERNKHVSKDRFRDLFKDEVKPNEDRWLSLRWFRGNPYSPLQLEKTPGDIFDPDMSGSGLKWRAAFEDLMNAALDKPMEPRSQFKQKEAGFSRLMWAVTVKRDWNGHRSPGLDWILALQSRGTLPPLLPSFYNACSPVTLYGKDCASHISELGGDKGGTPNRRNVVVSPDLHVDNDFWELWNQILHRLHNTG